MNFHRIYKPFMPKTQSKYRLFERMLDDWRFLLAGFLIVCAVILFVIPRRYLGVIHFPEKQSKITRTLGNEPPVRSVLVINEIMYHPQGNERREEYLEIYNTSSFRIALDGWKIQGIQFNFPAGTIIEPHEYLVISADPEYIRATYNLPGDIVVGPYSGQLSNKGETLQIVRPDGSIEDEVAYDDGITWSAQPDGNGPSLELLNPRFDNSLAQAWHPSNTSDNVPHGTPGNANSVYVESVTSLIKDVSFFPVVPGPADSVTVKCSVFNKDELAGIFVLYRNASSKERFKFVKAREVQDHFEASIPSQPDGSIIEFFIDARLQDDTRALSPSEGERDPYVFVVDSTEYESPTPIYRIVMSPRNYQTLRTRDITSNEPLKATFIAHNKAWLGVNVRYRGDSSRLHWKKSYRLEFTTGAPFEDKSIVFLNGSFWERQYTGSYLYSLTGLPTPEIKLVRLLFNEDDLQTYADVEPVNNDFVARWFPNNTGGNLYRGIAGANLDYRGEDKNHYRATYKKYNNKKGDDYSDIIDLCRVFSYPSDENYIKRIKERIDVDEWITYFACTAVLGNQEGIYYFKEADDYFLYRVPSSGKFVIIPWDFDSTCFPMNRIISEGAAENVKRFLFHPEIRPLFYRKIYDIQTKQFKWEIIKEQIEPLRELTRVEKKYPRAAYDSIEKFLRTRGDTLQDTFPEELSTEILTSYADEIIPPHEVWETHVGWFDPPSFWKDVETTFTWYSFPVGHGFNHKSIRSFYDFGDYTSLYIRKNFKIPDGVSLDNLRLIIEYSGGFVAYLNGEEVYRRFVGNPEAGAPPHNAVSQFAKKNAEPEMFDLTPFKSLINPDGNNILAVQAYLHSPGDNYFVIHPWVLSGGPVPYHSILNSENTIIIGGTAPIFETHEVRVDDEIADYEGIYGRWSKSVSLNKGWNTFRIRAINASGEDLATESFDVFYSPKATPLEGALDADTVLRKEDSPFIIQDDIIVNEGVTLSISPGCVLIFSPETGIEVKGRIVAEGTQDDPVYFTPLDRIGSWSGIKIVDSMENNELNHSIIENASWWDGLYIGAVECVNSRLDMNDSLIREPQLVGIDVRDSEISLQHCHLTDSYSAYDGDLLQLIGNTTATIESCLLEKNNADAIDISQAHLILRKSLIRHCEDKGLSLGDGGSAVIDRVIITDCATGIGLKDFFVEMNDSIICSCKTGIKFYYFEGREPPRIEMKNSIVWRADVPLQDIKTAESIDTDYSWIQDYPQLSIPGDYNLTQQFINVEERDFRLYLYSDFIKAGKDETPLIDTEWLNEVTW